MLTISGMIETLWVKVQTFIKDHKSKEKMQRMIMTCGKKVKLCVGEVQEQEAHMVYIRMRSSKKISDQEEDIGATEEDIGATEEGIGATEEAIIVVIGEEVIITDY